MGATTPVGGLGRLQGGVLRLTPMDNWAAV